MEIFRLARVSGALSSNLLRAGLTLNSLLGALSCQALESSRNGEPLWTTYSNDCLSSERENKVQSDPSLQFVTDAFRYPAMHLNRDLGSVSLVNSWVFEVGWLGLLKPFLCKVKQGTFLSVGPKLDAVSSCSLASAKLEGLITSLALLAKLLFYK